MIDYKKHEYYRQNNQVSFFDIPPYRAICIRGEGDPNGLDFQKRVSALFSVAYMLKMAPRKGIIIQGYEEYKVYPLEGIWDISDGSKSKGVFQKSDLVYTLIIKQPDFMTTEVFEKVVAFHYKKLDEFQKMVSMETFHEGKVAQILHIGSYDEEVKSFQAIEQNLNKYCFKRKSLSHREIYLSDARKVLPDKLKTILRVELE